MADSRHLKIILDLKDKASKELAGFQGKLEKMQPAFKKMALAGTAAMVGISVGIGKAIQEAGNAEKIALNFENTFGESTKAINSFIGDFGEKFAFVESEMRDGANAIGFQLNAMGDIGQAEGEKITKSLLTAAGGLSDFFGSQMNVVDASKALSKGLAGNRQQLVDMGFNVLEEDLKATAEAMGMNLDEMTKLQEAQLFTKLIMEQTTGSVKGLEQSLDSFTGQQRALRKATKETAQTLGAVFIPMATKVLKKIQPVVTGMANWIEEHPHLSKWLIIITSSLVALVTVLSTLLIILPHLIAGIKLVKLWLIKTNFAVSASAGVWGLLLIALTAIAFFIENKLTENLNDLTSTLGKLNDRSNTNFDSLIKLKNGTDQYSKSIDSLKREIEDLEERFDKVGEEIAKINKKMADAVEDSNKRQAEIKMSTAELFIEQEEKIAKMAEELQEKTKLLKESTNEELTESRRKQTQEEVDLLRTQLRNEVDALVGSQSQKKGLDAQFREARRRADLTEFERKLEDLKREREEEKKRLQEKLAVLAVEKEAVIAQQEEITNTINEKKESIKNKEEERVKAEIRGYYESARVFIESEKAKAIAREDSVERYNNLLDDVNKKEKQTLENLKDIGSDKAIEQTKDIVRASNKKTGVGGIGEQSRLGKIGGWFSNTFDLYKQMKDIVSVDDAVITPQGQVIKTNPADYLFATKNPQGLGGGTNVYITGGNFGTDAGEDIGNQIIEKLKLTNNL